MPTVTCLGLGCLQVDMAVCFYHWRQATAHRRRLDMPRLKTVTRKQEQELQLRLMQRKVLGTATIC